MRVWWTILLVFAALGTGSARAELAPSSPSAAQRESPASAAQRESPAPSSAYVAPNGALAPDARSGTASDPLSWAINHRLPDGTAGAPRKQDESRVVRLPDSPNGLALGLSALASMGAFHACRSIRKLHIGAMPDWYHTGAVQIGQATPFDLASGAAALPVCVFDEPATRPAFSYRIPREPCSRLRSHFLLLIESPRGQPVQSPRNCAAF